MDAEIKSPVLRFVIHAHVWLALGVAAQLWWMGEYLWSTDLRLILSAACGVIAVYGAMRLLRMGTVELSGSTLMIWYRAHARGMMVLVIASAVMALVLAWPLRAIVATALWKPALLAALYVLPTALTGGRRLGLRRVPFLKAFVIAFVWAAITTLLPATRERGDGIGVDPDSWWMFGIQCCFFFALAATFDIRDLPYDLPSLRTLPQVFGERGAKVIAILCLLPMAFFLTIMALISYEPIEPGWRKAAIQFEYVLPILGLAFAAVLIARAGPQRPWWYWSLLLDGLLLLLPLLAWIGRYF